jgi:ribose 5-phosphate isomerase B
MNVYIGADHRGFKLKEYLKTWLISAGHSIIDCGNIVYNHDDDYPTFAFSVAESVAKDTESRGILLCGSAGGMTIAANKVKGIRCVSAISIDEIAHDRKHNNINILAISSDTFAEDMVHHMLTIYFQTPYMAEVRMIRRLQMISDKEH